MYWEVIFGKNSEACLYIIKSRLLNHHKIELRIIIKTMQIKILFMFVLIKDNKVYYDYNYYNGLYYTLESPKLGFAFGNFKYKQ